MKGSLSLLKEAETQIQKTSPKHPLKGRLEYLGTYGGNQHLLFLTTLASPQSLVHLLQTKFGLR